MNLSLGEPIQILELNVETNKYELSDAKLKKIFLNDKIKNVNLAIISIAGAFRMGKSFLLSFFLRYITTMYRDDDHDIENLTIDWLDNENNKLSGFEWRGGSDRHTTGIWIWSKIFTKTMQNGLRIGIILMDTQGTFDSESGSKNDITIFALSTMISSIQIFNLFNNIEENDLQYLQLFTEYGRMAKETTKDDYKPFQKLMFLVRDWYYQNECPYGLNGGRQKLEKVLEVKSNSQSLELQSVRKHLRSIFDEITCYLMPSPGDSVRSNNNFDGRLSYISPEFIKHLRELIPDLLKPNNVIANGLKKVHGVLITPEEFYNLIQQYWKVFESGKLPKAKDILTATTEAACLSANKEITEWYLNFFSKYADSLELYNTKQLLDVHENLLRDALNKFECRVLIGDSTTRNNYREQLKKFIREHGNIILGMNQSKRTTALKATIDKLLKESAEQNQTNLANCEILRQESLLVEEQTDYIRQLIKKIKEKENNETNCLIM